MTVSCRHGVNSIPELELMANFGIDYLKKMELMNWNWSFLQKYLIHKFFNSEIFLPWQSYFDYKLLGVGIPGRYSE